MRLKFLPFAQKQINNFINAVIIFQKFLPYFFSIKTLLKTLFSPWKNLIVTRKSRAFSFNEYFEVLGFNLVSRAMGFFCRSSIIFFYLFLQFIFFLSIPIILMVVFISLPIRYFFYLFEKTEEEKKAIIKENFFKTHLLDQKNKEKVAQWFEFYYQTTHKKTDLFTIPPMGRDWALGYTPNLDNYVDDLSTSSYQQRISTCYDRQNEIEQIEKALSKSDKANVIIVGEEGIGKHTIIDTLAKKIYEGKTTNPLLAYKRVLKLNLEKILNQYTDPKQREAFLEELLFEASLAKNVILIIDNFDRYVIDSGERVDLTIPIEKYAKSNLIHLVAITEPFLYQKFISPNDNLNHLFEKIDVFEIKKADAFKILLEKTFIFEGRYQINIPYETIENVIEKSEFFITDIPFPEKAINLLDLACIEAKEKNKKLLDPHIINEVLFKKTHIPTEITEDLRKKLINLESLLYAEVYQQEEAIKKLAAALRRAFIFFGKRKKPIGSFLFLGPTGVGKTQTAKSLAKIFFGDEKYLLRFDMTNYQLKEDIEKILALLTLKINQNPYGVLLLDEIEKANPDLINIFFTILDEGYFTNHQGQRIDCKNLIIIATSNAGADLIYQQLSNQSQYTTEEIINHLVAKKIFLPEFLNRFDGIVVYLPLTKQSITEIAQKYINIVVDQLKKIYQIEITISPLTLEQLSAKGFNPQFGARNLERTIKDELEDKIARLILEKKIKPGDSITL